MSNRGGIERFLSKYVFAKIARRGKKGDDKMKRTINKYEFLRTFEEWTANDRNTQFSREALIEIFDILTEYEESTGEEIELDVVAICCEFTEYNNIDEACEAYETDLLDHNFDSKFDALNYSVRAWEVFNSDRILVQE